VKQALAVAARVVQAVVIAVLLLGERYIFPALRMRVPQWYRDAERNRTGYIIMAFLLGNMIAANVSKSGAFEVYYDGQLIWSKLNSGQAPHLGAIVRALGQAVQRRS
jgi:thioredoxin reductase-like selenoprotein T